jgi:hypothetical protein
VQNDTETLLEMAERHVLKGEERIARQQAVIEAMERDNHPNTAAKAREILTTMQESLRLARQHLDAERLKEAQRGKRGPDRSPDPAQP